MKIKSKAAVLISAVLLFGCSSKGQSEFLPEPKNDFLYAEINGPSTPIQPNEPEYTASDHAEKILESMTTEEKIGQMFFVRFPSAGAVENAASLHIGGYILFAKDFENETPQSVREKISACQSAAKIPLLIGVDEEGGSVVRASKFKAFRQTPFKSMLEISSEGDDALRDDTREKSMFLKDLCINVNLAPVCDVPQNSSDYIYSRSFGTDVSKTSHFTAIVVDEMKNSKIGSVLKHFPGYGSNADTHTGIVFDKRTLGEFNENDFLPFLSGIDAGADSVLVSHNVVENIQKLPASLSPEIHNILRHDLGFEGVIMTDDLAMNGVRGFTAEEKSIPVLAVLAGNDMIISSSPKEHIAAVVEAFKTGEINEERINDAVKRILIWKINIGLIDIEQKDVA
ncbi:MAG: beta-hexosaminidase [Firmicutes bacterium]|nr:beta-hexosaminidase [Bacillota bacterium]